MARKKKSAELAKCIAGPIDGVSYETSHQRLNLHTAVPSIQHVYVRRAREDESLFYAYVGVLTSSEKID
jgi:hypothetical protein